MWLVLQHGHILFEKEKWSLLSQTILHFLTVSILYFPIILLCWLDSIQLKRIS